MIKPEQIPDEVVEAALAKRGLMREAIADALNAWPGMSDIPGVEVDGEQYPRVIHLPLTENTNAEG